MRKNLFLFALLLASASQMRVSAASIKQDGQSVTVDFNDLQGSNFTVYRSTGRFSARTQVASGNNKVYVDNNLGGKSPYTYYYFVEADGVLKATLSLETELFGNNVYFYSPTDNKEEVAAHFNGIGKKMFDQQFGFDRYALFFKPGDYRDAGRLYIGFYTSVAGLGKNPKDSKAYNFMAVSAPIGETNTWDAVTKIHNDNWNKVNSTCTFWRSMENLSVWIGEGEDYNENVDYDNGERINHWFYWGVSQAAPLRRVYSERTISYDFLAGIASGGFTADCYVEKSAGSFSQQQWYTRNSFVKDGSSAFAEGGWNFAYQGVEFGPDVDPVTHNDNWGDQIVEFPDSTHQFFNVSREANTPIIREKPFLFIGDDGRYKVFKPALRRNAVSVSWSDDNMGPGEVLDVINDFYVAKPGVSAAAINAQLRNGKHIIFTPGIYELEAPISVTNPNAIVLGLGYATLIPSDSNSDCALKVADVDGVTIAGLLFDTKYDSDNLLRVGDSVTKKSHADNPTLLADLFFRVGGVYNFPVNVDQAFVINSNDVIGDHFWIWRADHGEGTGWFQNTSKNGLVVSGDDVTIYGLFNEHFQEYQTLWYGENGRLYFYQCETPYDPQDQNDYLSHVDVESGQQAYGYSAYKVANGVKKHYASMLGIYDVFIYTNGAEIKLRNSIEIPKGEADVKIHHACNVCISNLANCGIQYVVGDVCKSTLFWNDSSNEFWGTEGFNPIAKRAQVVDFDGTMVQTPDWNNDTSTKIKNIAKASDEISVTPHGKFVNIASSKKDYTVNVYTVNGTKVAAYGAVSNVDLSKLANGVYFVKVSPSNGNVVTKKVVKN